MNIFRWQIQSNRKGLVLISYYVEFSYLYRKIDLDPMISQSKIQSPNSDKNYLKNEKLYIMISIAFLAFQNPSFFESEKKITV